MKLVRKSITMGCTLNIGNYESVRIEATNIVEYDKDESQGKVRAIAVAACRADLEADAAEWAEALRIAREHLFNTKGNRIKFDEEPFPKSTPPKVKKTPAKKKKPIRRGN